MDLKKYWQEKHIKYSQQDWIDKPTIFAEFAIKYFPKSGKLLDLGCGHGQDSRFFAKSGYGVVATEFSEKAIEFAKLKSKSIDNIEYLIHDLKDKFPFEDNSFDIVYSHLSIQFFDDKITDKIFAEIQRVLKPEGIVAIIVNSNFDTEIENSKFLYDELYEAPDGLVKRFYCKDSLEKFVKNRFKTILLDSNGETYKDTNKNLIRYIGKK